MQPGGRNDANVLQIALAPATVANREVDDRGRRLLVGAVEIVGDGDCPAGTPDERRLDEIVAEDVSTEGRLAGKERQAGGAGKRLPANDRIVAPVVAFAPAPPGKPAGDHRPVDAAGELMQACEQALAVDQARDRLDQARVRIGLDPPS
jgi:hypothetical protein